MEVEDYRTELTQTLTLAWAIAKCRVVDAQDTQKARYDWRAKEPEIQVGVEIELWF